MDLEFWDCFEVVVVVVLCPWLKTAKVMSGRSVNLATLFLGRLRPPKWLTSTSSTHFRPVTDTCPSCISGRRKESMWLDWVSNLGPLAPESDVLPTALSGLVIL